MAQASKLFTDEEKQAVSAAISEAEKTTSGEIVPVVAARSGRYDRAEDVFGVVVALLAVTLVWLFLQNVEMVEQDWGKTTRLTVGIVVVLGTFLAGFIVGTWLATAIPILAYPLIGKKELADEVRDSAERAFFRFRVRGTQHATGILIYVSLLERMVCVIGDHAIGEKLGQSSWDEVRDLVIDGLRGGKPADGLCAAIKRCGELLAEHFPIASDDVNELSNELHVID